jgi:hypothetical protein
MAHRQRGRSEGLGIARALLLGGAVVAGGALAGPTIRITPAPVVVNPGDSVQIEATVEGPSEYRVRWLLQGPLAEGTALGTLTQEGLYTAPAQVPPGPVRIVVQVSLGQYNLPVAATSVPVDILPAGFKPPQPPAAPPRPPEPPFAAPQPTTLGPPQGAPALPPQPTFGPPGSSAPAAGPGPGAPQAPFTAPGPGFGPAEGGAASSPR